MARRYRRDHEPDYSKATLESMVEKEERSRKLDAAVGNIEAHKQLDIRGGVAKENQFLPYNIHTVSFVRDCEGGRMAAGAAMLLTAGGAVIGMERMKLQMPIPLVKAEALIVGASIQMYLRGGYANAVYGKPSSPAKLQIVVALFTREAGGEVAEALVEMGIGRWRVVQLPQKTQTVGGSKSTRLAHHPWASMVVRDVNEWLEREKAENKT
jgi:hypothetical protein